jgi:hypothetical protein
MGRPIRDNSSNDPAPRRCRAVERCQTATLATRASRGGGPAYRRYGTRVVYRWGDLLAWAEARLSAPMHSTSEADAR